MHIAGLPGYVVALNVYRYAIVTTDYSMPTEGDVYMHVDCSLATYALTHLQALVA